MPSYLAQIKYLVVRRRELHWCTRLADLDLAHFEQTIAQLLQDTEESAASASPDADPTTRQQRDALLAAAIANLPVEQQTLFSMFKAGATYHHIGTTLRMSDESVLHDLARLLSQLATQTLSATEVTLVSH
jgi:DNA-directed RNA polymerase specialized sigma24 family protein